MVTSPKVDTKKIADEAKTAARAAVAKEKAEKANKKEMPISITERRKAEELLREKFQNLRDGLNHEVQRKRDELSDVWKKETGVTKILSQIEKHEDTIKDLEKQLARLCTDGEQDSGYYGSRRDRAKHCPAFNKACRALDDASNRALEQLNEQESNVRQKIWLGLLADDALDLLESVPTMSEIRSNGMSVLSMQPKKLLSMKPTAKGKK